MKLSTAKELLLKNFPDASLHAQSAEDWTGPFPLPSKIATYYAEIGTAQLEIWAYGNPWYLPSLAQLWDLQAGYCYHPETNERYDEWKDNWLVVAYDGGDPYIFDTDTEIILHDLHGQDLWNPKPILQDLGEMIAVFATLGCIGSRAGDSLTDVRGMSPKFLEEASLALRGILGNEGRAVAVLERLGWQ
jgi:hypothetical protein